MSNIDWSKAPEGATHGRYVKNLAPDFYRVHEGKLQFWNFHKRWDSCPWRTIDDADIVARPSTAKWSGPADGLPPVGCECEVLAHEWLPVKIVAHDLDQAVYRLANGGYRADPGFFYGDTSRPLFRTIRTPEQLAAEAREKAINELVRRFGINGSIVNWHELFAQMYDAGVFNVKE